jgi:phosphohistidine phosphatase
MAKTVYFIRHAKSSWKDPSLDDFDRPLNKRGKRDAPFMAQLLRGRVQHLDAIISSPAKRAITTARHFAKAFDIAAADIHERPSIYEAFPEDVLEVIQGLPEAWHTVLVFGHNPAYNSLANMFSQEPIVNVPTCGIFRVNTATGTWADFDRHHGQLTDFHFPKQYFS